MYTFLEIYIIYKYCLIIILLIKCSHEYGYFKIMKRKNFLYLLININIISIKIYQIYIHNKINLFFKNPYSNFQDKYHYILIYLS